MKVKALVGILFALGLTGSAMADIIDFANHGGTDPGTLSYVGGLNPLVGSDILISSVFGLGTPAHGDGTSFAIASGRLDFTTGNFVSYDSTTKTYTFGPGGSLTVKGSGPGGSSGTLLSGAIISATYQGGSFKVALAAGDDTKNPQLLAFFGEPTGLPWQFSGSVHTTAAPASGGGAFSLHSGASTDIQNSVPDGGTTVMLLGGALIGIATLRRKFAV